MRSAILLSAAIVLSLAMSAQNAGSLDLSFNGTGTHITDFGFQDNLTDVKVQPDQKILSCGTALSPAFAGRLIVMRHLQDGTPDLSFGDNGTVMIESFTESYAYEMQVRDDGKILVAGAAANPNYLFSALVMRLLEDGTPDDSFGTNGMVNINFTGTDHFAYGMREQADGKIVIAGTAIDANFNNQPVVIRLNENGTVDEDFGLNGVASVPVTEIDNRFNSLAIQSDGKIVAAGHISNPVTPDGQIDFDILLARFNADGTPDTSFDADGIATDAVSEDYSDDIFKVALSDNSIIVAGYTILPDFSFDAIALEYLSNGTRNTAFGTNGLVQLDLAAQDVFFGVVIQPDGKIVAAGTSGGFFFDNRDLLVTRLNTDGTWDSTFGTDGKVLTEVLGYFDEANAVDLQADGKIAIAGKVNNGAQNDACVARYEGIAGPNTVSEINPEGVHIYPNPVGRERLVILDGAAGTSHVTLTDISGRIVMELPVVADQGVLQLSFPGHLPSGVYLLKAGSLACRVVLD